MTGRAHGTGIFARGLAPGAQYQLVLQGKGHQCLQASDYYRWNLRLTGPQAGFTLYGMFDTKPR